MDLRRHLDVLRRHKWLIAAGVGVGVLLALLVAFRPGWDGGPTLSWRQAETWSSNSSLIVTRQGFPWGRATFPGGTTPNPNASQSAPNAGDFADPTRLTLLASIYSDLAESAGVRALMPGHPPASSIVAEPKLAKVGSNSSALPLILLTTTASTPQKARALNVQAVAALNRYLTQRQVGAGIVARQRAQLGVTDPPSAAVLTGSRPLTGPIVAFLLAVVLAVAAAYALESLRAPRREEPEPQPPEPALPEDELASWANAAANERDRALQATVGQ